MKKLIVLLALVSTSVMANANTARQAIKTVPNVGKALRGGSAAVKATDAAAVGTSIRAIVADIHAKSMPTEAAIAAFERDLSGVDGLDTAAKKDLVEAFKFTVVDAGCKDAGLSSDAYANLLKVIDDVVKSCAAEGETINGLAQVAKFAPQGEDGKVASDNAAKKLAGYARNLLAKYSSVMGVSKVKAGEAVQTLATRCGLNPNFAAYASQAAAQ